MEGEIIRDLGGGLILRRSRLDDSAALSNLNGTVFRPREAIGLNPRMLGWTLDLIGGQHPYVRSDDFLLVEEKETGKVVSSLVMLPQVWTYAGIPFGVGRPEMVATLPEYRNRGLVRALFRAFHDWSADQGHLAQTITGIPYFYRQFGYEMTVTLGGSRSGPKSSVARLKEGESEPYRFRAATLADIPFLSRLYDSLTRRSLLACPRDAEYWRYELTGRREESATRLEYHVIEAESGESAGYLTTRTFFHGTTFEAQAFELAPGRSFAAVTPSVLRYLVKTGEERFVRDRERYLWRGQASREVEFTTIELGLGAEHPAYPFVRQSLPQSGKTYAWFVRVPDLAAFLRLIAPALEERLAGSPLAGHTGELKLSFYRRGLRLDFERGQIQRIEEWKPGPDEWGMPSFPDQTFLQLLFGYRTVEELEYSFPDCGAGDDVARALLGVLFPKQASDVWPMD